MGPDICYILSNGFAARMVTHSGLLPALRASGISVMLAVPNADDPSFRAIAEKYDVAVESFPELGYFARGRSDELRRSIFEDVETNPSLRAKSLQSRKQRNPVRRARALLMYGINRLCVRSAGLRSIFGKIYESVLDDAATRAWLERVQPKIIVSTYPVAPIDSSFLYVAKQLGVCTVTHLLSWDNITCKGRFPVLSDYFLSWGPVMHSELQEYYQIPNERVCNVGVPHFDMHRKSVSLERRVAVLKRLGLNPNAPYLVFGMSAAYFSPREIDLVSWIAERVVENVFGADMQFVIRPHPHSVRGPLVVPGWNERLKALAGPRVAIDIPGMAEGELLWNMTERDLLDLGNLLSGAAVVMNAGSTFSLDAIMHDCPVVVTGFDGDADLPWWKSISRGLDYFHVVKLVELGGLRVSRSFPELEREMKAYIENPQRDAEGRARTRAEECGACDGRAVERIVDAFSAWLPDKKQLKVGL